MFFIFLTGEEIHRLMGEDFLDDDEDDGNVRYWQANRERHEKLLVKVGIKAEEVEEKEDWIGGPAYIRGRVDERVFGYNWSYSAHMRTRSLPHDNFFKLLKEILN